MNLCDDFPVGDDRLPTYQGRHAANFLPQHLQRFRLNLSSVSEVSGGLQLATVLKLLTGHSSLLHPPIKAQ